MIANYADHSANERTFLAWVRTAIAVVGFGLAAARLNNAETALWSEVLLLLSGAAVILLAFLRMQRVRKNINAAEAFDDSAVPADTFLLLLIAALFAMLAMFTIHIR